MIAFAGNSLLCRLALKDTPIDAATFTSVRLISGAFMLCRALGSAPARLWVNAGGGYCLGYLFFTRQVLERADPDYCGKLLRAVPFALALSVATAPWASLDVSGFVYAVLSGALASGVGYANWYTALKALKATEAATVQLSVPVIAALGGIVFLGEHVTARLLGASTAILGGIAIVILDKKQAK